MLWEFIQVIVTRKTTGTIKKKMIDRNAHAGPLIVECGRIQVCLPRPGKGPRDGEGGFPTSLVGWAYR